MKTLDADTTVRELLGSFPNAIDVLLAHGMCEDCRTDPPPVPLRQFAEKHCEGRVAELLAELNAVIQ